MRRWWWLQKLPTSTSRSARERLAAIANAFSTINVISMDPLLVSCAIPAVYADVDRTIITDVYTATRPQIYPMQPPRRSIHTTTTAACCYPFTIPTVTSASPSPPSPPRVPKCSACTHRSHAHRVSLSTSASARSCRTCSSSVTTSDCAGPCALSAADGAAAYGETASPSASARLGVSCHMCGAGRCSTRSSRSICCIGKGMYDEHHGVEGYVPHAWREGKPPFARPRDPVLATSAAGPHRVEPQRGTLV